MSKCQIHVHWREAVDGESSTLFKRCTILKDSDVLLAVAQGKQKHFIALAATQLITITPEKETV